MLQFQPTSTLHQVCNPTTPKSTLGTFNSSKWGTLHFQKIPEFWNMMYSLGRCIQVQRWIEKVLYFKFQNLLWGSSWIWGPRSKPWHHLITVCQRNSAQMKTNRNMDKPKIKNCHSFILSAEKGSLHLVRLTYMHKQICGDTINFIIIAPASNEITNNTSTNS